MSRRVNPLRTRSLRGLTLLELVLATAMLSMAAVSMLGWFKSAERPVKDHTPVAVGMTEHDRASDLIVSDPSRFGVPRDPRGTYRWESAGEIADRNREITGRYSVRLIRSTTEFDRIEITGPGGTSVRWFVRPPEVPR